ncbi:unnamed protein product [Auanema sp. JU1783]|nr:unnamed protein product [Auanema sp. JU1783]
MTNPLLFRSIVSISVLACLCDGSTWSLQAGIHKSDCSSMTKYVLLQDAQKIVEGKSNTNFVDHVFEMNSTKTFDGVLYLKNSCIGKEKILLNFPTKNQYRNRLDYDDYHVNLGLLKTSEMAIEDLDKSSCSCENKRCSCCEIFQYPKFDHSVCVNITYNADTIGIEASIGIDGFYFTKSISARNPPPICFAIPSLHDIASVCIAFTDLDMTKKLFTGCIFLEAEFIHLELLKLKIGCFKMPI